MKIYVKNNWSEQFIYGDKSPGFFAGRRKEIDSLLNTIKNNDSSAILVASVRGVGKTTFVHKSLAEYKKAKPVFVNIGHALLSNSKVPDQKQLILKSLIRAVRFNKAFSKDKDIIKLYEQTRGKYSIETISTETEKNVKAIGANIDELKNNSRQIFAIFGGIVATIGLPMENVYPRVLIAGFGIGLTTLSLSWKSEWFTEILNREHHVKDNSTEYFEIEFENWLRDQNKKIVFVIDELDKIAEVSDAFEVIKGYKNLFTRSFAHFIFIADNKTFELVNANREDKTLGVIPTFFTHIYYLPLPQTEELKEYLQYIFIETKDNETEIEQLMDYLLFKSGNDFFELKRLIADLLLFDDKKNAYIDTEIVKTGDNQYVGVSQLFGYIDEWHLKKNNFVLKKHWEENSKLQTRIFTFLNKYYNVNFSSDIIYEDTILQKLVVFLTSIGALTKREATAKDEGYSGAAIIYNWTHKFIRPKSAKLTSEDNVFRSAFRDLIQLANNVDNLHAAFDTGEFPTSETITEGRDGQEYSEINLYQTYTDYKSTYEKLSKPEERISVTNETVKKATNVINEQINNVFAKYFEVLFNFLKDVFSDKPNILVNKPLSEQSGILAACPNFVEEFGKFTSSLVLRDDYTKVVVILKDFDIFDNIEEGINSLINQKHILILNLSESERSFEKPLETEVTYRDKINRQRTKKLKVDNFINIGLKDIRQLVDIAHKIENHLFES